MKLYNLYLIRKIASYFLIIASILILLIWFSKAISVIKFMTENGISITNFFNLFILILPYLLLIIIPVSLFIAVLVSYNQMTSHNEIIILKNAGLDKLTLAKPAIFIATICCLTCFFISFFLMPYANKKLRTIKTDFTHNYANLLISPGIFENLNSLTIYVKSRDLENHLEGILIYDNRNPQYSTTITSKAGNLDQDGNSILLYLENGTAQRFNYETKKSDILRFDSYVVNLNDNDQTNNSLKWKASERYIGELIDPDEESTEKDLIEYYVEIHQRITFPFLSMALTLIATAFILSGKFKRHGNFIHNIKAVFTATIFVGLLMLGYSLMRKSSSFTSLIYIDLLIFILLCFLMLKSRRNKYAI